MARTAPLLPPLLSPPQPSAQFLGIGRRSSAGFSLPTRSLLAWVVAPLPVSCLIYPAD